MMILRRLFAIYKMPSAPVSNEEHERRKAEMRKGAVARAGSGNVLLQKGKYSTREDIDRLKNKVLSR